MVAPRCFLVRTTIVVPQHVFVGISSCANPVIAGTLVAVPLSRYPKSPLDFLRYQFYRTLAFFGGKLTVWGNRLDSMPGWTSAPRYKPNTRQIATTAKTLYREVLEAFAAGDVDALHRLCVPAYASRMIGAVSRRDPKEEVLFEVVKYHQPWRFPQLKSHQIRAANEIDQEQLTEQAVVAISSTQQLSRRDRATGQIIPGSTKLQEKVEYVVLARNVNKRTWDMDPWKIWGTTSDTPLEKYLADKAETETTQDKHLKFKTPATKR